MAIKGFDWDKIRERYIKGDMSLTSLSREATGDPTAPTLAAIYRRSSPRREDWDRLRMTFRQQLIPIYPVVPTPTSLPAPVSDRGEVLAIPESLYEEHYATYLPQRILDRVNKVIGNPEILSLHQDIAVSNGLLGDIAAQIDTGESGALWKLLRLKRKEFNQAETAAAIARKISDADEEKRQEAIADECLKEIFQAIEDGAAASEARDELAKWQLHKKVLIDAEIKRLLHIQAFVRIEDFAKFAQVVMDAVTSRVKDPDVLYEISTDIERACSQQRTEAVESTQTGTTESTVSS